MTAWAQLLHFYQPPTQTHEVLRRVADESYRPLLKVLGEHPAARLAINMNGVLTELLHEHGLGDVLASIRALHERGQVEIVGSGKFHPILPLLPPAGRRRSIAENAALNSALLGAPAHPAGFFPPEMCYAPDLLPDVAAAGARWLIMSGVACPAPWTSGVVYRARANGATLPVLFRDDVRSNRISFRETDPDRFLADLAAIEREERAYVVTAMDAETYGHHISGWEREFLAAVYERIGDGGTPVRMLQPSEVVAEFPPGPIIEPHAASWSTTPDDLAGGNPFPLWRAPGNAIHAGQWEIVDHCFALVEMALAHAPAGSEAERFARRADASLQPALHSCQFWWASRRPMWDPLMVQRGLALLEEALIFAGRAIELGDAGAREKSLARWRTAAAREAKARIEDALIVEVGG